MTFDSYAAFLRALCSRRISVTLTDAYTLNEQGDIDGRMPKHRSYGVERIAGKMTPGSKRWHLVALDNDVEPHETWLHDVKASNITFDEQDVIFSDGFLILRYATKEVA